MNHRYIKLLQHALGADSRYNKKQWGFRNRFCADSRHEDYDDLVKMVDAGLMVKHKALGNLYFSATTAGAVAIGFKSYQLANAGLKLGPLNAGGGK